jgi:hypothetical protein
MATFLSVTRLRVRSFVYLPQFLWYALRSARQAEHPPRFSRRQIAHQRKERLLDLDLVGQRDRYERIPDHGRAPRRHAQVVEHL